MLACYINGTEYNIEKNFTITEQSGNKTASTISVIVENQPVPVSGDIITILDTDTNEALFWGQCGIPSSPKYSTGLEPKIYQITCSNANAILSNRIANVAFQGYTVSEIVNELYTQYISEEGISLGIITPNNVVIEVYTADNKNLQDCINELADLVGATWQVTPQRVFNFIGTEDFPVFPQTINSTFLLGTDLQSKTKDYKTRTVQYIAGATDKTTTQTETYTYDGEAQSFTLVFPIASTPQISVNGVPVASNLIWESGLSQGNEDAVFVYSYNSQIVSYQTSSDYLSQGDVVTFSYIGVFSIRISAYNDEKISEIAALTGTSGKKENVQIAADTKTINDAQQLANSLLEQFAEATTELSFWLLSSQLYALGLTLSDIDALTQLTFDLPALNISGQYVITERQLTPFYADMSNPEQKFKVTLKLKDRDYLKSYGETISDLRKDINSLSIREDDIVIQGQTIIETVALSETVLPDFANVPYPTETLFQGSIVVPCLSFGGAVYPRG